MELYMTQKKEEEEEEEEEENLNNNVKKGNPKTSDWYLSLFSAKLWNLLL